MPLRIQFSRSQIQEAVDNSQSYRGAARYLGYRSKSAGVMIKRWVEEYEILTAHFGGPGSHTGRSRNFIYTRERLAEAVLHSRSFNDVSRYLGRSTLASGHLANKIRRFNIDTSHFMSRTEAAALATRYKSRRTVENFLVIHPPGSNRPNAGTLRRLMIESGIPEVCAIPECGVGKEWNGQFLVLQVDHENGQWLDNRPRNLRFLCPNCHSQQLTTGARGYQPLAVASSM